MANKSKPKVSMVDLSKDLWINPRSNMRGEDGSRAWDNKGNITPTNGARFLELADIALGNKKPTAKKKKGAAAGANGDAHDTGRKTEPYRR